MCWLSDLFKPKPPVVPPVIPPAFIPEEYILSGDDVGKLCMGANDHVYVWDSTYYAFSLDDWKAIIPGVLKDMPKFLAEKWDCDDFAFLCMTRVAEKYEVNSCGVAVGNALGGYHAWNLFIAKEGDEFKLHALEPQHGTIDPEGYIPDTVIFS